MSFNGWRDAKLDDFIDILSGYAFKSKEFIDTGVPVIKIKNIVPPNIDFLDVQYVTEDMYKGKIRYALEYNDILISLTGSNVNQINSAVGKIGRVRCADTKLLLNQRVGKVYVKDENKNSNDFLYYYLIQEHIRYDLASSAGGSANQANINPKNIKDLKIKLPPIEEQKDIAKILSDLDNKIEVNTKINKRLEEMAQAIFKQWFVDFEFPNEEENPYKSSGGKMVESELGMIPKGWEVKNLGSIGNIVTGKTPSAKDEDGFGNECNFITPRDIGNSTVILETERLLSSVGAEKLKKNKIYKNSIGVSCIGSNLGEVYITGEDSFTNQQINSIILDDKALYPYVYIYLKNMKLDFLNMSSGSAVPIINKTSFSGINILIPQEKILYTFIEVITGNFEIIKCNIKETEKLKKLRDTLLPKLMSGEIRVSI
ncbi:restriction endonuclease subunit S [Clostridium gasigenes]|uniref:restriction endonuclease subunit S n=1 Tax=Clostridium gasigenes TaxID=94869 RepID=UPI00162A0795|nr:restriction endonuclease subunit S [Clostridium gasigenes]MBB6625092.1 restriction endonuclease subunit S [Clostridium gasigenes]MBU3138030.1 restriction endonuclease subunit S [Clostridium gasigenes]